MPDNETVRRLFYWNPPRLDPGAEHERPVIESMLAQMAAMGDGEYEHRLALYNAICDKQGLQRFPKVTITREEQPAPKVEPPASPASTTDPAAQPAPKKTARKASKPTNA